MCRISARSAPAPNEGMFVRQKIMFVALIKHLEPWEAIANVVMIPLVPNFGFFVVRLDVCGCKSAECLDIRPDPTVQKATHQTPVFVRSSSKRGTCRIPVHHICSHPPGGLPWHAVLLLHSPRREFGIFLWSTLLCPFFFFDLVEVWMKESDSVLSCASPQ